MGQIGRKAGNWTFRAGMALLMSVVMTMTNLADVMAVCSGTMGDPLGRTTAGLTAVRAAGISVTESGGYNEGAYAEWRPVDGANGYVVSVSRDQSTWTALDDQLIRRYEDHYRADALGLTEGTWYLRIEAGRYNNKEKQSAVAEETVTVDVTKHDRSGYAWVGGTASGAYNEDGSLKADANVVYVTNANKDRVTLDVVTGDNGATTACKGLQDIFNKYQLAKETKPLCVRLIGRVDDPAVLLNGDLVINNQHNGSLGMTIEGVGEDAVAFGWGIVLEDSSNVEVRNLAVMNCDSSEGDNFSLVKGNDHIWIHNCDSFYGEAGTDADQSKGDGAMDCKTSTYVTFSYNHFWDNGKCCLLGLDEGDSFEGYITYHHNWFDHSDSRHPRVRYYTAHVYNNYYDGNAKYGIGSTLGSSIFAESNYFRNCKYPMLISLQGSDSGTFSGETGGIIKAYGNYMEGQEKFVPYGTGDGQDTVEFDAYVAAKREDTVPASVRSKTESGSKALYFSDRHTYNNFDTAVDFYEYTPDAAEDVPDVVTEKAGRVNGGDFRFDFGSGDDVSYGLNTALKEQCRAYESGVLFVGGIAEEQTIPIYFVTMDPGNGENSWIELVKEGKALEEPSAPANVPAGKAAFDGWFYQEKKWDFKKIITEDMTLTGRWLSEGEEPTVYGIVPIGTEIVRYQIVTPITASAPNKDTPYFEIAGNHKKESGSSGKYEGVNYTGRYRLIADGQMSVDFITERPAKLIIFIDNGTTKKIDVDGTKCTAAAGIIETRIAAGSHKLKAVSGSSTYVYGIWVIPELTVTVDKGDGSDRQLLKVFAGAQITQAELPDPVRQGFRFDGWLDEEGQHVALPVTVDRDRVLTAAWTQETPVVKNYTVTIDLAGGTAGDIQNPILIPEGGDLTVDMLPALPVREGYVFTGWVDEAGQPVQWPVTVNGDMVIRAAWKADEPGGNDPGENDPGEYDPAYADTPLAVVPAPSEPDRYVYTGRAVTPRVVVYNYGRKLTEGEDYTVKYSNNIRAAGKDAKNVPKITVTGRGNLTGSASMQFVIEPKNLADEDVVKGSIVTTKDIKAVPVMIYNGERLGVKDYEITEAQAGEKYAENGVMKVKGTGNYAGEVTLDVIVVPDKAALKNFTVEMGKDILTYNGTVQFPGMEVKDGAQTLVRGTDYVLCFSEETCTNAGTAKVTIVGINSYSGSVTKTYKISPLAVKDGRIQAEGVAQDGYTFRNGGVTIGADLAVTYRDADRTEKLVEGRDYKITYSRNKAIGTAKYTVNFLGNYKGSAALKSGTFRIKAAPLNAGTAKVVIPDKVYGRPAVYKSVPIVTMGGVALKNSDFTVAAFEYKYKTEFENDNAAGTPEAGWKAMDRMTLDQEDAVVRVKIVGKGNYAPDTGDNEEDFLYGYYRVCRKSDTVIDMSKAKVTFYADTQMTKKVGKMEFTGKAVEPAAVKVEVKAGKSTVVLEPDQYTITYTNNTGKGKATAVVTGTGLGTANMDSAGALKNSYAFVGSKNASFTITARKVTIIPR